MKTKSSSENWIANTLGMQRPKNKIYAAKNTVIFGNNYADIWHIYRELREQFCSYMCIYMHILFHIVGFENWFWHRAQLIPEDGLPRMCTVLIHHDDDALQKSNISASVLCLFACLLSPQGSSPIQTGFFITEVSNYWPLSIQFGHFPCASDRQLLRVSRRKYDVHPLASSSQRRSFTNGTQQQHPMGLFGYFMNPCLLTPQVQKSK